jgi:hypothetical protein
MSQFISWDKNTASLGLIEETIRRIDSPRVADACSGIAILGPAAILPQTPTHFSRYCTGLHNFTP